MGGLFESGAILYPLEKRKIPDPAGNLLLIQRHSILYLIWWAILASVKCKDKVQKDGNERNGTDEGRNKEGKKGKEMEGNEIP